LQTFVINHGLKSSLRYKRFWFYKN